MLFNDLKIYVINIFLNTFLKKIDILLLTNDYGLI